MLEQSLDQHKQTQTRTHNTIHSLVFSSHPPIHIVKHSSSEPTPTTIHSLTSCHSLLCHMSTHSLSIHSLTGGPLHVFPVLEKGHHCLDATRLPHNRLRVRVGGEMHERPRGVALG